MIKKFTVLLFLIFPISLAYSQCTSSLGTPIIYETFGSGVSTVGPQLPAGITNLQYVNNTCPNDGQYSIVNFTTGCYTNAWQTVTDHTGNANGYFMLINASYQPSDFYVQTVNGLCDGTTYQFSSWIFNMLALNQILPNITFTIEKTDGTILGTYSSGDIPVVVPGKWKQYGFNFKTPPGISTVVIRMHNNAPGGIGNDLALDDISFAAVGPPVNIGVTGFNTSTITTACNRPLDLFSTIGSCYLNNAYQWQISPDGTTWTDIAGANGAGFTADLKASGTYYYRVGVAESGTIASVNCRVNSNSVRINYTYVPSIRNSIATSICFGDTYVTPSGKTINKTGVYMDTVRTAQGCDSLITFLNLTAYGKLVPDLGPDRALCAGDSIILNPGSFEQYLWQDNSTKPAFKVTTNGTYWVKVTNGSGCTATDTVIIKKVNCSLPNIPNTFTPNNDGINDTWNIPELQYFPQCTVYIYTRWGVRLFNSIGYSKPWDGRYNGKDVAFGTYYYVIDLKDNKPLISGYVTVVR